MTFRKVGPFEAAKVKASVSPLDFYANELGIDPYRHHREWIVGGICPFHNDTAEGSFHVNLATGGFNCFSCGSKGGDIIAFIRLRDELTFAQAIAYVANAGGLQ